jgi:acyl-CoA synthetase (AMP-forming)/AMP-acid ligase II
MKSEHSAPDRFSHPLLPSALQEEYRLNGHWSDLTLAKIVESWANRDPERIAVTGGQELSYADLWEKARRVAGALTTSGLRPGEFMLSVMPNSWQGVVLQVAASVAGVCLVPRSMHLSPTVALNLFEQMNVRALVLNTKLLEGEPWRVALSKMTPQLNGRPIMLQGDSVAANFDHSSFEQALQHGSLASLANHAPCQPSLVLSTGGSTGQPKSILHCSEALVYASRNFAEATNFTENDVHVAFLPYGHAAGSVLEIYMPLMYGAKILPVARWQAKSVAEEIERWGGTYFITMGTHIFDLLALEQADRNRLRSLRLVTSGAGPDALFVDGERELGFEIVRVYGFSECPGHAVGRPGDPPEVRLYQDGVPYPGIDYRIVDVVTGKPVARGGVGEYQCRGPNLFMGYVGSPELTRQVVTEDGFYRSGDLLVESDQGYVNWRGRSKDIIRRGGLQIDSVEMEGFLDEHPKISTVVVVGVPDSRLGERAAVVAVAESADDAPSLNELCDYLLSRGLEKQSLPERLVLVDELPRTELGKFHRVEVRRRLMEEWAEGVKS